MLWVTKISIGIEDSLEIMCNFLFQRNQRCITMMCSVHLTRNADFVRNQCAPAVNKYAIIVNMDFALYALHCGE